jgi:Uma2 family endonuclease
MARNGESTLRTRNLIGPADHGREMSEEEFESSVDQEGFRSELIDGRLYVAPIADLPHGSILDWLVDLLQRYRYAHPEVIDFVHTQAEVFVPGRLRPTRPQPDIACYANFPHQLPRRQRHWRDVSPTLVVEIVSDDSAMKDFKRNVALYEQVPSIREYWIVDQRPDPDYPSLRVYRRRGKKWQKAIDVAPGETYTTRLLPGFELKLDAPPED